MTRSYEQFCPIARTLDVIGERWTLLILRQLLSRPHRFTDLQANLDGISPTLLRDRLSTLRDAGLIRRVELPPPSASIVYEPTSRGAALEPVLYEIARWGLPLLDQPTDDQPVLPTLVRPGLKALCRTEALPRDPLTVGVHLDEGDFCLEVLASATDEGNLRRPVDRIVVTDGAPEHPDVTVRSQLPVLLWLRRGDLDHETASEGSLISLEGDRAATRAVEELLGLHGSPEYAELHDRAG